MCGPSSAISLEQHERDAWVAVREQLRVPGQYAGLMRGFLGGEEVAVAISTDRDGRSHELAVLITAAIEAELSLSDPTLTAPVQPAAVGDYDVEVLVGQVGGQRQAVAVRTTPWMRQHLLLYARQLRWPARR
jgi:hypothetical protein